MARAGRKRKLKPRYPSGSIRKEHREPLHEWTLPPVEQIDMRTAILGSRTARGEISEPFTHLRPLLSDEQIAAAERFQRHWARARVSDGPCDARSILGAQQAMGAISSGMSFSEDEAYHRAAYTQARLAMTPAPRATVELLTGRRRPLFVGGDHILWFQNHLSRHLSSYRTGLTQLSKHYGFDKVAKSGVWVAE
jgi:hypothetical protein